MERNLIKGRAALAEERILEVSCAQRCSLLLVFAASWVGIGQGRPLDGNQTGDQLGIVRLT